MSVVSDADRRQYAERGFMVLKAVIPSETLTMLREECAYFLGYMDSRMDTGLVGKGALSWRGRRYFINNMYRYSTRLWRFLYGELMADVCRNTLGPDACLFNEQWVVKGAEQGMQFAWHQDSGYVKAFDPDTVHPPYLTCWCTLDAVSTENGTVSVLDHESGGTLNKIITHSQDPETNDLIGYAGDHPGTVIEAPAGSIIAFTSYNLHRSGANTSGATRRVYLPQYASAPIINTRTGEQFNLAVPFLRNGEIVYDRSQDNAANWGGSDGPNSVG
ncbi:MAG: phytanoyl-CoA dioxygenase family protein [Gammaproteobacteria bacterium]|nr:phytanoyl-CoA dioxygenase family protein [Gammaproteobacteria bacterium]MXY04864.1 phytanoyl-CoA dioxygenase family protein [Gammaproteobacteria bacterium]MYE53018.1 phytanoyl-CoA dioxygenase family protein [Gammaproteobacteria bacterium]MYG12267.1 phytanoyl-CoA dioxygenase family protein [Gammaproteobacteria bacterium]MYH16367.1 phytanoyl-CoA dioxygenase family protein [Gammaproteobacteria bacterium]